MALPAYFLSFFIQEADIAAGALIVTDERRQVLDFTEPFLSLRSSALLRKPRTRSSSSSAGGGDASSIGSSARRRQQQQRQQPTSTRITTADQLLSSDLQYGVVRDSVTERHFRDANDSMTRALWARASTFWPPAAVANVQEGVERARREQYAFVLDSPMAEFVASRRPCDLYATEPFLAVMTYAFAVRKADGRLRQDVDREMRRMQSGDDMQQMYLRWWRDECGGTVGVEQVYIPELADEQQRRAGRQPSTARSTTAAGGSAVRRRPTAAAFSNAGSGGDEQLRQRGVVARALTIALLTVSVLRLTTTTSISSLSSLERFNDIIV